MTEKIRLNIGCGLHHHKNYLNVDISPKCNPDLVIDLTNFPWPWDNDSVMEIIAEDIVEHIPGDKTIELWNEIYRICEDRAIINVKTPFAGSEQYWSDPTHQTGYRVATFEKLAYPENHPVLKVYGYMAKFKILQCLRNEKDMNLYVIMEVRKSESGNNKLLGK